MKKNINATHEQEKIISDEVSENTESFSVSKYDEKLNKAFSTTRNPKPRNKNNGNRNIGYIRVSTIDQNTDRQLTDINLDKTYTDNASGKDTNRPELQRMLNDIESGLIREGDTIHVHSMDRLARNLDDLRKTVSFITTHGVKVHFRKESHTFTNDKNSMSELMLNLMGAFAEFERSLIKERQREGIALAKARADSPYKGRKPKLFPAQVKEMVTRIEAGERKAAVAREYNISRETLYQYLNKHKLGSGKAI